MKDVLTLVLGIIGVVTFIGAVTVYLKGSADKGTITSLKESVAALQIADGVKTGQIEDLTKRLAHAEAENALLRGTVTQAKEVATLTSMLSDHHIESMASLTAIREAMTS